MKICYLCGEFVSKKNETDRGVICPKCEVHYCKGCSTTVNNCYICGSKPERYVFKKVPSSDPEKIFSEIERESRRAHPRREYKTTVEYFFNPETGTPQGVKRIKAVTKNISDAGVCIYTMIPHEEGQRLRFVQCNALGEHCDAEVRWSKKVNETLYKAGLMFLH